MNGKSVAAKSRQPWDHSTRLDNVSLHASSTSKAVSCNGSADQVDPTARRAAAEAELVKSVTLHNDSACLAQCPIGTGFKLRADQLPYPRANSPVEELAAIAALLAFFSWGLLLILLLPGCLAAALLNRSLPAMLFLAIITIDCLLPPGNMWPAFRNCALMEIVRRHYRMRIITPPQPFVDTAKHYLTVEVPHAVFPMTCFLNPAVMGVPGSGTPGPMMGAVASILLQLPFYEHIFAWLGGCEADAQTLKHMIKRYSLAIQPEGIAGILWITRCTFLSTGVLHGGRPGREAVFLKQRKGFVRVAIQTGADILPVYHLGDSQLFEFKGFPWLSRKLRMSLGIIWGRWGLPLPRQHDLIAVIGYPIQVKQADLPSSSEIDRLHAKVLKAITSLYEEHKHLIPGWESRPLHII